MRGLYVIIDPETCSADPLDVARAALRGGCAALQLRAKRYADEEYVRLGRELASLCRTAGLPFFVNDRVGLVREIGAAGVHLGQNDAPLEAARAALGTGVLIGVSTHSLAQAIDAEQRGADLIGFGPVFATQTKFDTEPVVGVAGLREVCVRVKIPVIAIGGVSEGNVAEIAAAGAPVGAVISAVCRASDPERAARVLHGVLRAT